SRFNQKGCLSPHDFYVAGNAREFAEKLAAEMAAYESTDPRGSITPLESAEIADLRANYRFRAASDPRVQVWESENSTAWTV
ncbi:acyl-CoA reductase, partial [Polaromonas sp. CT11-55]|uniref:acyl-CoA reductase n=1 Tax=Polaromonas sp. CT11-55 TaxID=3243045 RepID=UPI0039A6C57B